MASADRDYSTVTDHGVDDRRDENLRRAVSKSRPAAPDAVQSTDLTLRSGRTAAAVGARRLTP